MDEPIRVIIVDDAPDLARLYCRAVDMEPGMQCVATLSRADDLGEAICTHKPNVVVLDLTMPGLDPIEALRTLSAEHTWCRILVFSGHSDARTVEEALDAGAWGLVSKAAHPRTVLDAIRRVAGGEMVLGDSTGTWSP